MKFCTKCGAQLNDEAKFCPKCGTPTAAGATAQESRPQPEQQTAPAMEQPVSRPVSAEQGQQTTGKKSPLPLIIGIIAAVVILGVVGFFAYSKLFGSKLVGSWQDAYGISSFTFNKDGNCSMDVLGDVIECTYEDKDGVLTLSAMGIVVGKYPYQIEGDKLTIFDPDTGEGSVYYKVTSNGSVETTAESAAATAAPTAAETAVPETTQQTAAETTTAVPETTPKAVEDPFEGFWWFGKTELTIAKSGNGYEAEIYIHDSAAGGYEYHMTCTASGESLVFTDGTERQVRYSEDLRDGEASIVERTGIRGSFTLSSVSPDDAFALQRDSSDGEQYLIWEDDAGSIPPASAEYICWYSSDLHLSEFDISFMSKDELRLARNEIFARHGRKFASQDLQDHFNSCSWYHGTVEASAFDEKVFSDVERDNIKFIEAAENGTAGVETYYFSSAVYNNNGGYQYGISYAALNGNTLTVEGVINGVYQTVSFVLDANTVFTSTGGEDPTYEISKQSFMNAINNRSGLGVTITVLNGSVIGADICS